MYKKISVLFLSTMLVSLLLSGSAFAFLQDWQFDPSGTGSEKETISNYFDISGPNYILSDADEDDPVGTDFTFNNFGFLTSTTADGGSIHGWTSDYELTGIFNAEGSGEIGGDLSFSSGTLDIYVGADSDNTLNYGDETSPDTYFGSNDGTPVASFELSSGSGSVDAEAVPNGQITLSFSSTFLEPSYWFDSSDNDLSTVDPISFILGFSTTNASFNDNPSDPLISEMSAYMTSLGYTLTESIPPDEFFLASNGQFRLAQVPEPTTMLLFGTGLLGLGFFGRRKFMKKNS